MPQSKRTTLGVGSIRKITRTINGMNYTYYEARYTAGFDSRTGKKIQRSTTDKSKKVVAQKLRAAMAAKQEALDTHTIQRFYNSLIASGLSPKTVKNLHGILHCTLQ